MAEPYRHTTADPKFDPTKPVLINGFKFMPAAQHYQRVTELLEANNRYLERARAAEREVKEATK